MKATVRLEEISNFFLESEEIVDWYKLIAETPIMNLKILKTHGDTSHVPPDILSAALVRVEAVQANLSNDQYIALLKKIAICENLSLTDLDISYNVLSAVPADVLVSAISRLKKVNLENTDLTPVQINDIFTLVAENTSSKLRHLELRNNDISSVPGELRERAKLGSVQIHCDH